MSIEPNHLERSLAAVTRRLEAACGRSGRDPASVRLVAVTKSVGVTEAALLVRLGVRDLGESRVQELLAKQDALAARFTELTGDDLPPVRWHLIGHLQRRKARQVAGRVDLVHSGDSLRVLEELDRRRDPATEPLPVLLQVNVSGEASKGGVPLTEVRATLAAARELQGLEVCGLMTMAPATGDPETARPVFRALRRLRDALRDEGQARMDELSMGMSGDFEVAVEEGATLVRLGRVLLPSEAETPPG